MNCFYSRLSIFALKSFLLLTFLCALTATGFAEDGEKLFKNNCSRCHTIGDGKSTGPDLKDVASRVPQPADEWLFNWIKNNKKMIAAGDAYGVKVFNENGKQNMDVFDGVISDEDIKTLIAHIKNPPVKIEEIGRAHV